MPPGGPPTALRMRLDWEMFSKRGDAAKITWVYGACQIRYGFVQKVGDIITMKWYHLANAKWHEPTNERGLSKKWCTTKTDGFPINDGSYWIVRRYHHLWTTPYVRYIQTRCD